MKLLSKRLVIVAVKANKDYLPCGKGLPTHA